jgi:hypothetical protein
MLANAPMVMTGQARRRILFLKAQYEARIGKDLIVAIVWIDSALNNGLVESQPAIGLLRR